MPRVVRRLRVSPRVPRNSRLLCCGPERLLLRCSERSPLHQGAKQSCAPLCANPYLQNHQRLNSKATPKAQTPPTPPKPIAAKPASWPAYDPNATWGYLTFSEGKQVKLSGDRAVVV